MATYLELATIKEQVGWNEFLSKVRVAAVQKATLIIGSGTPGALALEWAKSTVANPATAGNAIVNYIIMVNDSATTAQILAASDAAIQGNVNTAIDAIYGV